MSKPTGPAPAQFVLDKDTVLALRANLRKKDEARPVTATVVPAREPITLTATVITNPSPVAKIATVKAPALPVRKESLQPKKVNPNKGRALPARPVKAATDETPPAVPPRDDLVAITPAAEVTPPPVPAREEVAPIAAPVPPAPPAPPAAPKMPAPAAATTTAPRPALLFSGSDLAAKATRLKKTETRVTPVVNGKVAEAAQPKENVENGVVANAPIAVPAATPKGMGIKGGMDELQAKIAASAARRSIKI